MMQSKKRQRMACLGADDDHSDEVLYCKHTEVCINSSGSECHRRFFVVFEFSPPAVQ